MPELSGKIWVNRFPTQTSINALMPPFRECVQKFVDALKAGKVKVSIADTLRPPERAYLMHFSFEIAMGRQNPETVPRKDGVDIIWVHDTHEASVAAAREMVSAYKIRKEPSLTSNHIKGLAIDMTLNDFAARDVRNADGTFVKIASFDDLISVGETYNVFHKVLNDLPHWSFDGH